VATIVVFRCGERRCALDRAAVDEVTPLPELSHPPGMPTGIEGYLNLGGEAVVVVDAARLFGLEQDADVDPLYRHILILGEEDEHTGLLVDRVEDVKVIADDAIMPAPAEHSLNDSVVGQVDLGGSPVFLLAADRILLAAEKERLAGLKQAEQARLDALDVQ
jgi:purine-binding chemotaxis protein CheW